ncbi:hypothetical protein FRD01_00710 [Microvenator marinus]|uniref:PD-(D/E)XK nuclease-like domain-containing protein n=1 Tax=Microvenator marinus TaxID=2600177 RepID=A0A5B8XJV5_9DELT|nr:hypothetical protein [Microvenator marinus]QED25805.1 hypothetical protein FRD01_00710 [Microvenator marinus]
MTVDVGPVYTKGKSYRARAEARQREYRSISLSEGHGKYGHILSEAAANKGSNFIIKEAFVAAQERQQSGKGVAPRTFENMLSSQAMCFNLFAPLATWLDLATEVLKPFIEGLSEVTAIHIEYTPDRDVFNDQTGRGGVDCDLLIEGRTHTGSFVQVIETKFVEPEFSTCGFRKSGRAAKDQAVCPNDVPVREDRTSCLYSRTKGYRYWQRTDEHNILAESAFEELGCPFGGPRWQLWVNLALAHEEASRRDADDVRFAICSSSKNIALLGDGAFLKGFRALLKKPETVSLIDLDGLLIHLKESVPPNLEVWANELAARYGDI